MTRRPAAPVCRGSRGRRPVGDAPARILLPGFLLLGCASAGTLSLPPDASRLQEGACAAATAEASLATCSPILYQETAPGPAGRLDRPAALDPDGSGTLADDLDRLPPSFGPVRIPLYAAADADAEHLYLFYGLYYPADWSGPPDSPRIDHAGDFEGALVVVSCGTRRVEAVITQAHRLFYLWLPPQSSLRSRARESAISGTVALSRGRPLLFAESGGHGLYVLGSGSWNPRGGRRYPTGPAGVPASRLLRIDTADGSAAVSSDESPGWSWRPGVPDPGVGVEAEIRPLADVRLFARGDRKPSFAGLGRGARPPWSWTDRRGRELGEPGAIVTNPGALLEGLLQARRP